MYVAGETIKAAEYLVADPTAQVIMKVEDGKLEPRLVSALRLCVSTKPK